MQTTRRQRPQPALYCLTAWLLLSLPLAAASEAGRGRRPDIDAVRQRVRQRNYSFQVGDNPATRYPLEQLCGLKIPDNARLPMKVAAAPAEEPLPERFDWRLLDGCTPIKNQGGCGSCWAFAAMGIAESQYLIRSGEEMDFSEQWLVSCTEAGSCDGGWYGAALNYMIDTPDAKNQSGAPLETTFPYEAMNAPCNFTDGDRYRITGWTAVQQNIPAMKAAIQTSGPIAVTVYAEDLFQCYVGGIFDADVAGASNHAVVLVGWDDTQGSEGVWFLRNSWGSGWGENGYMRIEYGRNSVGGAPCYADYIPDNEPNTLAVPAVYPTIAAAMAVAADGDVILLAEGVYTGEGNVDIDFGGKNVTIRSLNPSDPNRTVIDCQGSAAQPHRAFRFVSGEGPGATLNGLTVRNGYRTDNGGAIYSFYSHPTIKNCVFENNTVTGYKKAGGAIALYNSNATISRCVFRNNQASGYGGAISCRDSSSPTITGCRIIDNTAGTEGGGIYGWVNALITLEHTVLAGNHADDAGGGLFFYECADAQAVGIGEPNVPAIAFCTLADNSTNGYGGGLFAMDSLLSLRHCILWNNTAGEPQGSQIALMDDSLNGTAVYVNYCNVTGLDQGHWVGTDCTLEWGLGNLAADPLFADPSRRDYHLRSAAGRWDESLGDWVLDDGGNYDPDDDQNSPCIDAGDPEWPTGAELQCHGGRVNLGAYGATDRASRSPHERCCMACLEADFNCDCIVNLEDLAVIAADWLHCNLLPRYYCNQ